MIGWSFGKSLCFKSHSFGNTCVKTLCLGFKELNYGKAAMKEDGGEIPAIYTTTAANMFCFVCHQVLFLCGLSGCCSKFSWCENRITLEVCRFEGETDSSWIPREWKADGHNSGHGTGVATDCSYLSFSVLLCSWISARTVEKDSSDEEFPVTTMFRSQFFPCDENCRILETGSWATRTLNRMGPAGEGGNLVGHWGLICQWNMYVVKGEREERTIVLSINSVRVVWSLISNERVLLPHSWLSREIQD